nr:meiotic recombination protein SPO11-1-like isoform X2 [Malus domestica]
MDLRPDLVLSTAETVFFKAQQYQTSPKRDIYYMHPSIFSDQSVVDRAINDICILLHCSRHNLNVVSVGKGYCQCSSVHTCCGERISFYYFYGCFSSQGRGYPDIPTRRFLGLLVDTLHLPIYCLVDCDPYGFDILSMYRFGSMQMVYDAKFLRVPEVLWLGAFPSDSDKYGLPQQCLLHLTVEDKRKTEAMLLRCYLQNEAPPVEIGATVDAGKRSEV